jgi:murein DD-endopeptidase MepM/ murein hydrolase activator NlpD
MWLLLMACATPTDPPVAPEPVPVPPKTSELPPEPTCAVVHSPFADPDRRSLSVLANRGGDGFGAGRRSYVRGHVHAGVDLDTAFGEAVYGLCHGEVVDIHLASPHRTVVVRHDLPGGAVRYASYKHVEDVAVAVGDMVDRRTRIGRVFDEPEQAAAPWRRNHLHFEVRHSIADGGAASWTSMSMDELREFAVDPMVFFAEHLGR